MRSCVAPAKRESRCERTDRGVLKTFGAPVIITTLEFPHMLHTVYHTKPIHKISANLLLTAVDGVTDVNSSDVKYPLQPLNASAQVIFALVSVIIG